MVQGKIVYYTKDKMFSIFNIHFLQNGEIVEINLQSAFGMMKFCCRFIDLQQVFVGQKIWCSATRRVLINLNIKLQETLRKHNGCESLRQFRWLSKFHSKGNSVHLPNGPNLYKVISCLFILQENLNCSKSLVLLSPMPSVNDSLFLIKANVYIGLFMLF